MRLRNLLPCRFIQGCIKWIISPSHFPRPLIGAKIIPPTHQPTTNHQPPYCQQPLNPPSVRMFFVFIAFGLKANQNRPRLYQIFHLSSKISIKILRIFQLKIDVFRNIEQEARLSWKTSNSYGFFFSGTFSPDLIVLCVKLNGYNIRAYPIFGMRTIATSGRFFSKYFCSFSSVSLLKGNKGGDVQILWSYHYSTFLSIFVFFHLLTSTANRYPLITSGFLN